MEQILKIESEQGFSETANHGDFINSKLIDLIIPGNTGTYDLSKTYININMELVLKCLVLTEGWLNLFGE